MYEPKQANGGKQQIQKFGILGIIFWTVLISASIYWNYQNIDQQAVYLATSEAKTNWNKDQAFRGWATRHGGLYVPPNDRTPPNPYLAHLPHRDITTATGQPLTLMNPAYMMSQMTREFEETYGVKGKITGQVLLNPKNKPDSWELAALKAFDGGLQEIVETTMIGDQPYVRLMRPMVMKKGCDLCHGHLGFKEGDIRGGVSVSVPLNKYLSAAQDSKQSIFIAHGGAWLVGMLGIGFAVYRGRQYETEREQAVVEIREAKEQAEKASLGKDRFLATMSHELRTPLNAILGFSQMMCHGIYGKIENERYQEYSDDINQSATHLLGVINDVLDISKIEAGKIELDECFVNIRKIVEDCATFVRQGLSEKNMDFQIEMTSNDLQLFADERLLRQILINLLSNAIKYTPAGGTITFSAALNKSGGIELKVSDTGVGIAKEDIPTALEPFGQIQSNPELAHEGTGLGLPLSKQFVELHKGTLNIESNVGEGTVIVILFSADRAVKSRKSVYPYAKSAAV